MSSTKLQVIVLGAVATTIPVDTAFKLDAIPASVTFEDPVNAPLSHVAQCLSVKVPGNASKHTTSNPKSDILQQGYHPGDSVAASNDSGAQPQDRTRRKRPGQLRNRSWLESSGASR